MIVSHDGHDRSPLGIARNGGSQPIVGVTTSSGRINGGLPRRGRLPTVAATSAGGAGKFGAEALRNGLNF